MNTTIEWQVLLPVLAGGALLGFLFFGGLLFTVKNGLSTRFPGGWFLLSMVLRMAVVLAGFYVLGQGEFLRFVAALAGFILVRILLTNRLPGLRATVLSKESRHDQSG